MEGSRFDRERRSLHDPVAGWIQIRMKAGGTRPMTRRELEIEAYSQKLFAKEAEQKAEDVGYALELLLNQRFKLFHTATTSDKGTHEFLMGIARNVPINDIFRSVMARSQTEDRRIILWKTTFGPGELIGSAYHEREFRSLPTKLADQAPELRELLQEAIRKLSNEILHPDVPEPRLM
jgi:hypothetical protein